MDEGGCAGEVAASVCCSCGCTAVDAEARANSGARVVSVPGDNEVCRVNWISSVGGRSSALYESFDSDLKSSSDTEGAVAPVAIACAGGDAMVRSECDAPAVDEHWLWWWC